MLNGSISNNKLVNQSISLGGVSVNLGESDNTPAFNLTDSTNYQTSNLVGTITNDQLAGSISNDKLTDNNSLTVTSGPGLTGGGSVELGSSSSPLSVDVDNSSLEIDSTTQKVKVKNGGITNDMLAGSIESSKITGTLPISSFPIKDENNMISNSSDHVPTQSSVRAYVDNNLSALVNSAPETLDTLNELAAALGDNPNFSTTVTTSIGTKLSKDVQSF